MPPATYQYLLYALYGFAALTFITLFWIPAPYGRHVRAGWGPTVSNRAGWVIMEAPAALIFLGVFAIGPQRTALAPLCLLALYEAHYFYRAFVFPFRLRDSGKRMPVVLALVAVAFHTLNSYLNARWITALGDFPDAWLRDPRFIAGLLVFVAGVRINHQADAILLALRKPGETGYKIPEGGFYRWVSCPNYLGEIIQWSGWAIATWSFAGLGFAVYTVANLLPRALTTHRWYQQQFADYPRERRAIVPFVL